MNDTNFISLIVKILESPKKKLIRENIPFSTFRAQLPSISKESIVSLTIWGNLVDHFIKHYGINDYVLLEGYIAFKAFKQNKNSKFQGKKKIEITVLKIYPFSFH